MGALLLLAFGGPRSLDEVEPFLIKLFRGRMPSSQDVECILERYRKIGGSSPLYEITQRQAVQLEKRLKDKGYFFKSYIGMRYGKPFISEILKEIIRNGEEEVFAIPMTPFRSKLTTGAYKEKLSRENRLLEKPLKIHFIEGWCCNPLFLKAWSERIKGEIDSFPLEGRKRLHLIFTAHSLPESVIQNDPYVGDFRECVKRIMETLDPLYWHLAFQSKGKGDEKWIAPQVVSVLTELGKIFVKEVLIVPVGFVSDHIEILYDIDIIYREKAESLGITLRRVPSLNDAEDFIEALAYIVENHIKRGNALDPRNRVTQR